MSNPEFYPSSPYYLSVSSKGNISSLGWETCLATSFCASVSPLESRLIILGPPSFWVVVKLASRGRNVYLTHIRVLGSQERSSGDQRGLAHQDGVVTADEVGTARAAVVAWIPQGVVVWGLSPSGLTLPCLPW